jgi:hypothetical protein
MSRQMAAHDSLASSGPIGSFFHTGTGPRVPPPCGVPPGMAVIQNNTIPHTGKGPIFTGLIFAATPAHGPVISRPTYVVQKQHRATSPYSIRSIYMVI